MSWWHLIVGVVAGVFFGVGLWRYGWLASVRRTPRYLETYRAPQTLPVKKD